MVLLMSVEALHIISSKIFYFYYFFFVAHFFLFAKLVLLLSSPVRYPEDEREERGENSEGVRYRDLSIVLKIYTHMHRKMYCFLYSFECETKLFFSLFSVLLAATERGRDTPFLRLAFLIDDDNAALDRAQACKYIDIHESYIPTYLSIY